MKTILFAICALAVVTLSSCAGLERHEIILIPKADLVAPAANGQVATLEPAPVDERVALIPGAQEPTSARETGAAATAPESGSAEERQPAVASEPSASNEPPPQTGVWFARFVYDAKSKDAGELDAIEILFCPSERGETDYMHCRVGVAWSRFHPRLGSLTTKTDAVAPTPREDTQ